MERLPLIDEAEAFGEFEQVFVDIRRTQGITVYANILADGLKLELDSEFREILEG